jgi:hypothetical protein
MPSLPIKGIPEPLLNRLGRSAEQHRRSLTARFFPGSNVLSKVRQWSRRRPWHASGSFGSVGRCRP